MFDLRGRPDRYFLRERAHLLFLFLDRSSRFIFIFISSDFFTIEGQGSERSLQGGRISVDETRTLVSRGADVYMVKPVSSGAQHCLFLSLVLCIIYVYVCMKIECVCNLGIRPPAAPPPVTNRTPLPADRLLTTHSPI